MNPTKTPDLILHNGRISATGNAAAAEAGPATRFADLFGSGCDCLAF